MMSAVLMTTVSSNSAKIDLINHPLPLSLQEEAKESQDASMGFIIAFNIVFGMVRCPYTPFKKKRRNGKERKKGKERKRRGR